MKLKIARRNTASLRPWATATALTTAPQRRAPRHGDSNTNRTKVAGAGCATQARASLRGDSGGSDSTDRHRDSLVRRTGCAARRPGRRPGSCAAQGAKHRAASPDRWRVPAVHRERTAGAFARYAEPPAVDRHGAALFLRARNPCRDRQPAAEAGRWFLLIRVAAVFRGSMSSAATLRKLVRWPASAAVRASHAHRRDNRSWGDVFARDQGVAT